MDPVGADYNGAVYNVAIVQMGTEALGMCLDVHNLSTDCDVRVSIFQTLIEGFGQFTSQRGKEWIPVTKESC